MLSIVPYLYIFLKKLPHALKIAYFMHKLPIRAFIVIPWIIKYMEKPAKGGVTTSAPASLVNFFGAWSSHLPIKLLNYNRITPQRNWVNSSRLKVHRTLPWTNETNSKTSFPCNHSSVVSESVEHRSAIPLLFGLEAF